MKPKTRKQTNNARYSELRRMLQIRQQEITKELQGKLSKLPYGNGDVTDQVESAEIGMGEDIEIALREIKTETLCKIETALRRLEDGAYGNCSECGSEISEARLKALMFAVRCKDCEDVRENVENNSRRVLTAKRAFFPGLRFETEDDDKLN